MAYACASAVTGKCQDVYEVYLDMSGVATGSIIKFVYKVIVPMINFNIFPRIRYLPNFFGVWTLEIVPILDKLVCKVIDYNGVAMNTCTHAWRETAFQFTM
jgi:hypothetical protein